MTHEHPRTPTSLTDTEREREKKKERERDGYRPNVKSPRAFVQNPKIGLYDFFF